MWDQLTTFWSLDEGAAIKHASGQLKSLCKKGLLVCDSVIGVNFIIGYLDG